MATFEIKFKRFQHTNNVWANASRTYTADTPRDALKKFNESFAKDTVPPRMTSVFRLVMVGEVETIVRPKYVK